MNFGLSSRNRCTSHEKLQALARSHPVEAPFRLIYIDHWSCHWHGRECSTLVVVDSLTRWAEAFPVKSLTALETLRVFVLGWILRFGPPKKLISDNGAAFISKDFADEMNFWKIQHEMSLPRHPQGNAVVESVNKKISSGLRQFRRWVGSHFTFEEAIAYTMFVYRALPLSGMDYSPAYLAFGIDPRLHNEGPEPLQVSPRDMERLEILHLARREVFIKTVGARGQRVEAINQKIKITDLHIGQQVLAQNLKHPRDKLELPWAGPFKIISLTSQTAT